MHRVLVLFGLLVGLCACGGEPSPETPEDEAQETPERSGPPRPNAEAPEAEEPEEPEEEPAVGPTVEASESRALIEPAIGQWVRYGVSWRNGGRSFTRYSIVDREAGGFWVEVEDRRRTATRHVRMHLRPRDDEPTELLALLFKRNGEVEAIPPRLMPEFRPMLQQWISLLFPDEITGEVDPETIGVPGGAFNGTLHTTEEVGMGEQTLNARIWRHPAVPISGMVKLSDEGAEHTVELLGYGLEGATSAFR